LRVAAAVVFLLMWIVYLGQAVSVVDFGLAQRLGLQERPGTVDPLVSRLELGTARWDLLTLWTLPIAGILMLANASWWPYLALIGGGAYLDAGGREAVKVLGIRSQGLPVGVPKEFRLAMGMFALLAAVGALGVLVGLIELL